MPTPNLRHLSVTIAVLGCLAALAGCSDDDALGTPGTLTVDAAGGGDFTTVQAAIDAAAVGATVVVEAGTYVERLTVFKSLTLTGAGAATELRLPGAAVPIDDESRIRNSSAVVLVNNTADVVIENVRVTGPQDGIQIRDSRRVTVRGVDASGNGDDGIDVGTSRTVSIAGRFNDNGDKGVQVRDGSFDVTIEASEMAGNAGRGVRVRDSGGTELRSSTSRDNGSDGVQVRDSFTVQVIGNTITGNGGYGLRIESSPDTVEQDNVFQGNAQGEIRVD